MHALSSLNKAVIGLGTILQPFVLLIIRLYWGFAFFQAGWGKLMNIDNPINFFTTLNIPFPVFSAYLVGGVETIGGLCLLFGLASRLAAVPLAITMIVAFLTAHSEPTVAFFSSLTTIHQNVALVMETAGEFIKEAPFNFLMASLIVLCFGPGVISLDYVLGKIFCSKKG